MDFYEDISKIYDRLFPLKKKKIGFLKESAPGKRVMDLACGDGKEMKALEDAGFDVSGIDLEPEMVERALEKGVDAYTGNMLHIPGDENYDMIYVIGNSVCHLQNGKEIKKCFEEAYSRLVPGGVFVVQFINFKKFLKNDGEFLGELPLITDDELVFRRMYFRKDDKIRFHTEIEGDFETKIHDILLYPLLKDEAVEYLEETGFEDVEVFSGFDKSEYDETKNPVVLRAKKK